MFRSPFVSAATRRGERRAERAHFCKTSTRSTATPLPIAALEDFFCRVARGKRRASHRASNQRERTCRRSPLPHLRLVAKNPVQQAATRDQKEPYAMSRASEIVFIDPAVSDLDTILGNLRPGSRSDHPRCRPSGGAADLGRARRPPRPRRRACDRPRGAGPGEIRLGRLVDCNARRRSGKLRRDRPRARRRGRIAPVELRRGCRPGEARVFWSAWPRRPAPPSPRHRAALAPLLSAADGS